MAKTKAKKAAPSAPAGPLKLDLGCGKNKREGFTGVDALKFPGVDVVCNLGSGRWPWKDSSVDEVNCSHMIEHLDWPERVHFFNELYRVMKPGAKAAIVLPHWASSRYYGDPTHKSPFSEFAWFYLKRDWREQNAPHVGYTCNFEVSYGYTMHPELMARNEEYRRWALGFLKEAALDMVATAVAVK